jgi:hypothetical protein
MVRRKMARDLKTKADGHYTMSVSIESMVALEKIARDLEKSLGVRMTRAQVLVHVISAYNGRGSSE